MNDESRRRVTPSYGGHFAAGGERDFSSSAGELKLEGAVESTDRLAAARIMAKEFTKYLVVRPQDLNHAGTLFGGVMMSIADEMAFVAASLSYPGCTFVTKVFSEFNFVRGAVEGDIIEVEATVLKKGRSSVHVAVSATNAVSHQQIFHTEAVLVNAQHGKSVPIPAYAS